MKKSSHLGRGRAPVSGAYRVVSTRLFNYCKPRETRGYAAGTAALPIAIVLFAALGVATLYAAPSTQKAYDTTAGLFLTGAATDKVGFYGVTPAVQSVTTKTAWQSLEDHGLVASGADYSVQHTTVTLTAANIIAMYTTPVVIVAAPGSGKTIAITKLTFRITRTSTAFTGGAAAIFQYDSTANGAGTQALDSTLASTVITGSAGSTTSIRTGVTAISDSSAIENKGIYISNGTAVFAAGTGTAVVDVWYVVHGGI